MCPEDMRLLWGTLHQIGNIFHKYSGSECIQDGSAAISKIRFYDEFCGIDRPFNYDALYTNTFGFGFTLLAVLFCYF